MTRVRALLISLTAFILVASGCGVVSYEHRLEEAINDLKYRQKLDTYLTAAPTEPYKTLQIYVRPPKPMAKTPTFTFNTPPALWDVADTFTGNPPPDKAPSGSDGGSAPYPAMRLHILGRIKKKPVTAKKGAEPAEPTVTRGKFIDDVKTLLGSEFATDAQVGGKADAKKKNRYNRLDLTSGSSGNAVKVYFIEDKAGTEVALIFDIPPGLNKHKMVTTAIDLCLESLALGRDANILFGGGTVSETGGVKGGGAAEGPAF